MSLRCSPPGIESSPLRKGRFNPVGDLPAWFVVKSSVLGVSVWFDCSSPASIRGPTPTLFPLLYSKGRYRCFNRSRSVRARTPMNPGNYHPSTMIRGVQPYGMSPTGVYSALPNRTRPTRRPGANPNREDVSVLCVLAQLAQCPRFWSD